MREDRGHGPPWRGGTGPGWTGPPFGPGRRFRRGAIVVLLAVALLVAALATILASIIAGSAPAPGITIAVSVTVMSKPAARERSTSSPSAVVEKCPAAYRSAAIAATRVAELSTCAAARRFRRPSSAW